MAVVYASPFSRLNEDLWSHEEDKNEAAIIKISPIYVRELIVK